MLKTTPKLLIKSSLIGIVYISLSIYFVFITPNKIPSEKDYKKVKISFDELKLIRVKKTKSCYFIGEYDNMEMKSIKLDLKRGLDFIGANEFSLQVNTQPKYYELIIALNEQSLFKKRHTIYQISDENKILLNFNESAIKIQNTMNKLYYGGLVVLIFIAFILINTFYKKYASTDN